MVSMMPFKSQKPLILMKYNLFFLCWLCFCSPIYEVIADSRWWRYTSVVFHQEFCTSMWIFSPFWVNFDISCEVGTQLHSFACDYPLIPEKAVAPHSSVLAWKIPWMEEPARLQSMGSQRVRHDWATSLSLFTFMHWRRKWQPTPVFLPGESQGRQSLVGCRLWGRTESDTTKPT